MPIIHATVDIADDFHRITDQVNDLAREAVTLAAVEGAKAAAAVASQRSKTGRMAGMRVLPVEGTPDGWAAGFQSPVFYAWFQEYGTLGNRKKPLKQPPRGDRTREPGTGVEPLGFLRAGRRAGRRALLDHIARGLPR